jgi:tRNA U38,U39,U40 pseudouridine synthase TruA
MNEAVSYCRSSVSKAKDIAASFDCKAASEREYEYLPPTASGSGTERSGATR